MTTLISPVYRLAVARDAATKAAEAVKRLRAEFEAAHAPAFAYLAATKAEVDAAEEEFRTAVMTVHQETGETKFTGGEVKVFTVREYPEEAAFAWAKETGLALALDRKAFDKLASVQPLPFVTTREEPRVTIKSDLSAFMNEEA